MLVEFRVKNFQSVRDEVVLSMVPAKDAHLAGTSIIKTGSIFMPEVLRTAAVFGGNATGKSSLLKALTFVRTLVIESTATHSLEAAHSLLKPFLLDSASVDLPSDFLTSVVIDGMTYQYGFVVHKGEIAEEWLHVGKTAKAQLWFSRKFDHGAGKDVYKFGANLKGQLRMLAAATGRKSLFIAIAAQGGNAMLKPLVQWFTGQLTIVESSRDLNPITLTMLDNPAYRKKICEFLSQSDLQVDDIVVEPRADRPGPPKITIVRRRHGAEARFDLEREEASGTARILNLAGPMIDAIERNKVLVVDDFDVGIHSLLVHLYVELFQRPPSEAAKPQLVATFSRSSLLDANLLRRDQIWFVNRNRLSVTELYSLAEFKVRKDGVREKGYLEGRYGGVPHLEQAAISGVAN